MPLSNRCRRLSVAPVAHLERQGCESLGSGSPAERIQNSFPEGSRFIRGTHPFSGLLPQLHPGKGLGSGGSFAASERSYQTGSSSFSRVFQLAFCNVEGLRVVATHYRPLLLEPHGVEDTIQDGDALVHPSVSPQGDWMVSVDLRDAYLQIPVHPESWKFLRFVVFGKASSRLFVLG